MVGRRPVPPKRYRGGVSFAKNEVTLVKRLVLCDRLPVRNVPRISKKWLENAEASCYKMFIRWIRMSPSVKYGIEELVPEKECL